MAYLLLNSLSLIPDHPIGFGAIICTSSWDGEGPWEEGPSVDVAGADADGAVVGAGEVVGAGPPPSGLDAAVGSVPGPAGWPGAVPGPCGVSNPSPAPSGAGVDSMLGSMMLSPSPGRVGATEPEVFLRITGAWPL